MIVVHEHQYENGVPENYQERDMEWSSWDAYMNALTERKQPIENVCYPSIPRNSHFVVDSEEQLGTYKCSVVGHFYNPNTGLDIRHRAYILSVEFQQEG